MSLIYNGTTIENAIYNGTTLDKIIFNGTEVFSAGFTLNVTISSNTTNYNIASAATALGWDGVKKLKGTITINSGVYVYSTSTGTPAFSTGTIPSGSDVTVVNNGTILGKGGNGGTGAGMGWGDYAPRTGSAGTSGGLGFYATSSIKVTNNGRISGGGGGGGGGRGGMNGPDYEFYPTNGGGGGGGIGLGSGGSGQDSSGVWGDFPSGSGGSGSLTSVGSGGYPYSEGGYGGNGGSFGSSGSTGGLGNRPGFWYYYYAGPYSGGGAGAAVVGSANITWNATGTRNGAIL